MPIRENPADFNDPETLKAAIMDLLMEKATFLTPDKMADLMAKSMPGDVYPERDLPVQIESLFNLLIQQIGQAEAGNFFRQQISPMKGLMNLKIYDFIEAGAVVGQWDHHLFL